MGNSCPLEVAARCDVLAVVYLGLRWVVPFPMFKLTAAVASEEGLLLSPVFVSPAGTMLLHSSAIVCGDNSRIYYWLR